MNPTNISLALALLTLFGVVWKGATIAGEMNAGLSELRVAVMELREGLKQLQKIPLLEQRVGQIETIQTQMISRIATMWDKLFSLDKHIAIQTAVRRASSPDLSGEP